MRVLVAEDNAVTRELLRSSLEKWGYSVLTARDGKEAWKIAGKYPDIGMFVIDWVMPGMNGLELCREIRDRPGSPPAYVLMLTSKDSENDVLRGLEAGLDDFLVKPVDADELQARIKTGEVYLNLQKILTEQSECMEHIRKLRAMLPICFRCGARRDDSSLWRKMANYVREFPLSENEDNVCAACARERAATGSARG